MKQEAHWLKTMGSSQTNWRFLHGSMLYYNWRLFLAFGIYLWFWLDKRHFYRRNVAGLEEFHSYFDMWKKTIKEYFVKSISGFSLFLGVGLIIMGIAAAIFI